jgi:hypothetical protein
MVAGTALKFGAGHLAASLQAIAHARVEGSTVACDPFPIFGVIPRHWSAGAKTTAVAEASRRG